MNEQTMACWISTSRTGKRLTWPTKFVTAQIRVKRKIPRKAYNVLRLELVLITGDRFVELRVDHAV
jgi:hypothetical protein